MAKFNVVGFDSIEKEFAKRPKVLSDAAPKMLKAGAKVLVQAQKQEAETLKIRDTGQFIESIKATPIKNKDGVYSVDVYPQGVDDKGVRNATKGFVAEYGTSRRPARPWMSKANENSADDVHKAMRDVWEAENK